MASGHEAQDPKAPSSSVGNSEQGPAGAGGASGGGSGSAAKGRKILADAAEQVDEDTPWYQALGLRWEQPRNSNSGSRDEHATVEDVLAFNTAHGVLDAANEAVLAPILVVYKELHDSVQSAAFVRAEVVELLEYCVGISRCLLGVAKARDMPQESVSVLHSLKRQMEEVGIFVQTYGTQTGCCSRVTLKPLDRATAAEHKRKLADLLFRAMAVATNRTLADGKGVQRATVARDPRRPNHLAEIPRGAPSLPRTHVERPGLVERIVRDLVDPGRRASAAHSLLGVGGGGKTMLASSVVRDERVRSRFKDGIFWVPVGRQGHANVYLLLENLARELAANPSNATQPCPPRFDSAEDAARYVSGIRAKVDLLCLVVLDNVWNAEVANSFASTGFHLLVTTRQRAVVPPANFGLCTEVGVMSEAGALEILHKASRALGQLPAEAAEVARACGMLPLALGVAGALVKGQPIQGASWLGLHERLEGKLAKGRRLQQKRPALSYIIEASFDDLPSTQRKELQLMAAMASGVPATSEMLANLWSEDVGHVVARARVLVDRCLLQDVLEGYAYRLHDLVLEFTELSIKEDGSDLAKEATSRQARYLARLGVLHRFSIGGGVVGNGGLFSLVASWDSLKELDRTLAAEEYYKETLEGVAEIGSWREAGRLLCLLGNYEGAETMLKKVLDMAEKSGDDSEQVGSALSALSLVLQSQGKFEEAEPMNLRAIEIGERSLGPSHPNLVSSFTNRAGMLQAQGKFEEAESLYARALAINEEMLGADHLAVATDLTNLAGLLRAQGKLSEADLLYRRAIAIREHELGVDHPAVATDLNNWAGLLHRQGNYADAERFYERSQAIREKALGPEHPDVATVLNNRAALLKTQGKYAEAQPLYRRTQEICERALGPNHPNVATLLNNRAQLATAQGKYDEAAPLYLRAIKMAEETLGRDHPNVGTALINRAEVLKAQGDYEKADELYLRAIEIWKKVPDLGKVASALNCRGGVLKAQGKHVDAKGLYERATATWEIAVGSDHSDVAKGLNNQGSVAFEQGRYIEAQQLYMRAQEILEKSLGPHHANVATMLINRARCFEAQENYNETVPLLEAAVAIQRETLGERHAQTTSSCEALKDVRSKQVVGSE